MRRFRLEVESRLNRGSGRSPRYTGMRPAMNPNAIEWSMSTIGFEYASSLANIDFGSVGCKPESEGKVKLQGYLHLSLVQIPAPPPRTFHFGGMTSADLTDRTHELVRFPLPNSNASSYFGFMEGFIVAYATHYATLRHKSVLPLLRMHRRPVANMAEEM
jgi:hypothetical protein